VNVPFLIHGVRCLAEKIKKYGNRWMKKRYSGLDDIFIDKMIKKTIIFGFSEAPSSLYKWRI
jgi:hypothetical protein